MLVRMQCPFLPGEKGVAKKPNSKKNNADNKRNDCHGQTIYSLLETIVKQRSCLVHYEGLKLAAAIH